VSAPHIGILCIDSLRMNRIGMLWETLLSPPLETGWSPQGGSPVSLVWVRDKVCPKTAYHYTNGSYPMKRHGLDSLGCICKGGALRRV
jgi:hypothetical protein